MSFRPARLLRNSRNSSLPLWPRATAVSVLFLAFAGMLWAQDRPFTVLPYTPSLDTKFMDRSADPCTNFYQYACGNWNQLNPIPADQSGWSVYAKLSDENEHLLWGILEQASQGRESRTANEQKIGDLFHACMDQTAIDAAGLGPIQASLDQIANLKSIDGVAAYLAEQHRAGRRVLFGFGADQDFDNSSQVIAFAFAGGLGLPDRDYYTKTDPKSVEIRQRYVKHVEQMFVLLGEPAENAKTDAQSVMTLETALANASLTRVEQRDPYNLRHRISPEALNRLVPRFNWQDYFTKSGVPSFQVVNVTEPKFMEEVNTLLSSQSLTAWRAYLRWQLVHSEAPYLVSSIEKANFDFFSHYLSGVPQMPARWKKCTRIVDRELGEALGQVFVEKTFSPKTKAEALKMTGQIEQAMEHEIDSLTWMSGPTKQQALIKLHAIVNKIGYPDKWRDYSSVQITSAYFLNDVTHTSAFEYQRQLAKIGKPLDRTEWGMSPPTVDAYYNPQMNDINFPAGVLQPPLFDPKMDDAPNYGNTGATIGHELTHGFDDEGRQFDAQGNLKDWWTAADAKAFEQRIQCIRDQYAQYVIVDDIHINSKLTSGEDVADLGGTLLGYIAWKKETADKHLEPIDDLTPEQRYFVGMAQWACGDNRPETKRMRAIIDPHSPLEYRINGVVSDLPQFGAAFACHAGQPMMRSNACRVW